MRKMDVYYLNGYYLNAQSKSPRVDYSLINCCVNGFPAVIFEARVHLVAIVVQ